MFSGLRLASHHEVVKASQEEPATIYSCKDLMGLPVGAWVHESHGLSASHYGGLIKESDGNFENRQGVSISPYSVQLPVKVLFRS